MITKKPVFNTVMAILAAMLFFAAGCVTKINEEPDRQYSREEQELIDIHRDIHRYPELSGQEVRTSKLVANFLQEHGLEVESGIGGYGIVAIFGLHVTNLETGHIIYREGPLMPGFDIFQITITGSSLTNRTAKQKFNSIVRDSGDPGIFIEFSYTDLFVPPVINDVSLTNSIYDTLKLSLGEEKIFIADKIISKSSGVTLAPPDWI